MMTLDDTKVGFYQVTLWYIRCSYVLELVYIEFRIDLVYN